MTFEREVFGLASEENFHHKVHQAHEGSQRAYWRLGTSLGLSGAKRKVCGKQPARCRYGPFV
jgi:hypothetical protein